MEYSQQFKSVIEFCKKQDLLYLGTGTPNARILIIGKECAIDPKEFPEQYQREIKNNIPDWEYNVANHVQQIEETGKYNPFYPYKGQKVTSKTWNSYQKLVSLITRKPQGESIDFHEDCFLSELNENTSKYSNEQVDILRKESIKKRGTLFKQDFFRSFPIVIMACGHYSRDYGFDIEDVFQVKWQGETIPVNRKWYNVHYSAQHDRILIHTNQLSVISNQLLEKIADLCRKYY